jgi:hypothetical protein
MLGLLVAFYIWFFGFRNNNSLSGTDNDTANSTTENESVTNNNTSANITNTSNNTTNNATNSNTTTNTTPTKGTSSTSGNITVTTPAANATIQKTFTVSGFAKVFENVVQILVKDSKGVVLLETYVNTDAADVGKTGTFKKTLTLEKDPTTKKGTIQFFTSDAATGAQDDLISVSVNFQ